MDLTIAIPSQVELAETPIWDSRRSCLYWTDLLGCQVHRFTPGNGQDEAWDVHSLVGSAVPTSDEDRVLCALSGGMYLLDTRDGSLEFLVDPKGGDTNFRYNDTRVDAKGRIFTSTMSVFYGTPEYDGDHEGQFLPGGHGRLRPCRPGRDRSVQLCALESGKHAALRSGYLQQETAGRGV